MCNRTPSYVVMRCLYVGLLAVIAAAGLPQSLSAAPISWTLTDFNASTLDLSGNVVQAVNVGPEAFDVTIGGDTVTFVPGNPGLANGPSGILEPLPDFTNTAGNAELSNVMASHGWQAGGPGTVATATLTGLFPGVEYELQAFMYDGRDCCLTRANRYSDDQGNETAAWTRGDGAIGIGTFTADASTQDFWIISEDGEENTDPGLSGYVLRAISGGTVDAVIDRDTGELSVTNNTAGPLNLLGYSVLSDSGSLSQDNWATIAGNLDAAGDGSIDSDNSWTVLSDPASNSDLSEAELEIPAGDGGTLGVGATLDLGPVWIKNPTEDVSVELLLGSGDIPAISTSFEGNGGQSFELGDLNFDGSIGADDWDVYIAGAQSDLSDLSPAEAYQMGDLTNDGVNDIVDMDLFIEAFDAANGAGEFAAMVAGVPEPSTVLLLALGCTAMFARRLRGKAIAIAALAVLSLVAVAKPTQAAPITWGEPFPILSDADIAITGTVVAALNAGPGDGPEIDVTLGGQVVTFTPAPLFAGNNLGAGGIPELESTGNDALDEVFDSHSWEGGDPIAEPVPFTLSELNVGQSYQVQIVAAADARDCCLDRDTIYLDTADGSGNNSDSVFRSVDVGGMRFAHSVVGTFTADDVEQNIWIDSGPVLGVDPGVSAVVLQTATGGPITLSAEVNTSSGEIVLANRTEELTFEINGYQLTSEGGSLNVGGWNSLSEQNIDPVDGGDESGETWDEAGGASNNGLQEGFLLGSTALGPGDTLSLGAAYNTGVNAQDLEFRFRTTLGALRSGTVEYDDTLVLTADFNSDGTVDEADLTQWEGDFGVNGDSDANGDGNSDGNDFLAWQRQFGQSLPAAEATTAAVPEPRGVALALVFTAAAAIWGLRRRGANASCALRNCVGAAGAMMVVLALGPLSHAAVTLDREYQFGDDPQEDAANAPGDVVGSGPANVNSGTTLDSIGTDMVNFTDFQDLAVIGDPLYVDVGSTGLNRPGAEAGSLGVEFDGFIDALFGLRLNLPSTSVGAAANDYAGITNRGFQLWIRPNSAGDGTLQDVVLDTNQHGVRINEDGNWVMRYNGADTDSGAPVAFDDWTHVMVARPFGGAAPAGGSILYVNGEAVAGDPGGYDGAEDFALVISGNTGDGVDTALAIENLFNGVVDQMTMFVSGTTLGGADLGTFNLGEDNAFVASTLTGVDGDVNQDGSLDEGDVNALAAGWRSENIVDGVRVGDLNTLVSGDLNFDGVTDLADVFELHTALVAATGAGFDFSLLNGAAVPEPATWAMLATMVAAWSAGRRRRAGGGVRKTG